MTTLILRDSLEPSNMINYILSQVKMEIFYTNNARSVCIFTAPFVVLYFTQSNKLKHKLMVVASNRNIFDVIRNLVCLNEGCCPKLWSGVIEIWRHH